MFDNPLANFTPFRILQKKIHKMDAGQVSYLIEFKE